jgi:membrane protease YdiL (CAAX protease family)
VNPDVAAVLGVVIAVVFAAGSGRLAAPLGGRWWWADLGAVAGVWLFGAAMGQVGYALAAQTLEFDAADPHLAVILVYTTIGGGLAAVAFAAAARLDLGVRAPAPEWWGVAVLVAVAGVLASWGYGTLGGWIGLDPADQVVKHTFGDGLPLGTRVLSGFLTVTLGPATEELVFRGLVQGTLARRFGPGVALTVSATAFGLMHGLTPVVLASTLTYGVLWGWLRGRSGSVGPGLLAHALTNATALLVG